MATVTTVYDRSYRAHRGLHVALWVMQVLLAFFFAMAGFPKLVQPIAELARTLVWPSDIPAAMVRFIGAAELLGALGLILPAATRIKPVLTPLAAAGLALDMALATVFHLARNEAQAIPITLVLGALAALIAWGRFRKAVIPPR